MTGLTGDSREDAPMSIREDDDNQMLSKLLSLPLSFFEWSLVESLEQNSERNFK